MFTVDVKQQHNNKAIPSLRQSVLCCPVDGLGGGGGDGSRSLGLVRKGKICIIAKFHRNDFVV